MNKRLQTILETAENLMEIVVEFDSEGRKLPPRPAPPFRPSPSLSRPRPSPYFVRGRRIPPPSNAPSGLLGAGDSVAGYDSTEEPGGLLGAGSSVSGYDSGSDAPTPQPPSNNRPYPRLPRTPDIGPGGRLYPRLPRTPDIGPGGRGPGDFPGNPSGYIEYPTWPPKYRPIYPKAPPGDGGYDSRYGKPSPSSPPSSMTPRYGGGMKPIPIPGLPRGPQKPRLPR